MAFADSCNLALSGGRRQTAMHKTIQPIERPDCECGGPTHLERIESHPIHGKGFELRLFACEYCGKETTSETTPDDADLVTTRNDRNTGLSILLEKLRSVGRFIRSRGRSASTERAFPLPHK